MNTVAYLAKKRNVNIPPKYKFWITASILFVIGIAIIIIGIYFDAESIWRIFFHAIGGAVISLALVDVLHEISVAKHVRSEFLILGDFLDKGIERICTSDEVTKTTQDILDKTTRFKVLGIGNTWLLTTSNLNKLKKICNKGVQVEVLIPDPLSQEIAERYLNDEPESIVLDLNGLADNVIKWYEFMKDDEYGGNLKVLLFDDYPVINMSIYDDRVFVSPVLYKRRGKDCLTAVFKQPSIASNMYIEHFDELFRKGREITEEKLIELKNFSWLYKTKEREFWKKKLNELKHSNNLFQEILEEQLNEIKHLDDLFNKGKEINKEKLNHSDKLKDGQSIG